MSCETSLQNCWPLKIYRSLFLELLGVDIELREFQNSAKCCQYFQASNTQEK